MILRDGTDADGEELIRLIGACWAEYPGCVMDLETECAWMCAPATHLAEAGGRLLVSPHPDGGLAGVVTMILPPAQGCDAELKSFYVRADARGTGLAQRLLDAVEREALTCGAANLILWSDTRFLRAHRFYERRGFVAAGAIRALHDLSNSLEYPYAKPMRPCAVRPLDPAACRSAIRPLAACLVEAAGQGADLPVPPTLAIENAERFFAAAASRVASGGADMFGAWSHGRLAGAAILDRASNPEQSHRADLSLVLIDPSPEAAPLADALLSAVERHAAAAGRTLLIATGRPDLTLATTCLRNGWRCAGTVPGYGVGPSGEPFDAMILYRQLSQEMRA